MLEVTPQTQNRTQTPHLQQIKSIPHDKLTLINLSSTQGLLNLKSINSSENHRIFV